MEFPDSATLNQALEQIDAEMQLLVLVSGTLTDGSEHYAYASIPPSRYQAFREAEAKGNYDLGQFGTILAHGEGTQPAPEVRERMEREHGANHMFESDFADMLKSIQQRINTIKN